MSVEEVEGYLEEIKEVGAELGVDLSDILAEALNDDDEELVDPDADSIEQEVALTVEKRGGSSQAPYYLTVNRKTGVVTELTEHEHNIKAMTVEEV
jgi:hypothetical protein